MACRTQEPYPPFALQSSLKGEGPIAFETAVTLHIARILDGTAGSHLDRAFKVYPASNTFKWMQEPAQLVAFEVTGGEDGSQKVITTSDVNVNDPRIQLGKRTSSAKATLQFLQNPQGRAFLFPDQNCGPDVILAARLPRDVDKSIVFILCQMKKLRTTSGRLTYKDTMHAIQTVDPTKLFVNCGHLNTVLYHTHYTLRITL